MLEFCLIIFVHCFKFHGDFQQNFETLNFETLRRKPGRPKTTRRRTVTQEPEKMNLSWGEAQHAARDRVQWRVLIEAS